MKFDILNFVIKTQLEQIVKDKLFFDKENWFPSLDWYEDYAKSRDIDIVSANVNYHQGVIIIDLEYQTKPTLESIVLNDKNKISN